MSNRDEQYTPEEIPLSRGYSRFLYCGVSVGEMARIFSQVGKVDELVCFEPDPINSGRRRNTSRGAMRKSRGA